MPDIPTQVDQGPSTNEDRKARERERDKLKKQRKRANQSSEAKERERENDRVRHQIARVNKTTVEKEIERGKDRKRKAAKKTTVRPKDGLRSKEILNGSFEVPLLEDTDDAIGTMSVECNYCGALKFPRETSSSCCLAGKVPLEPFPRPTSKILDLWVGDDQKSSLFRKNSRSINNAVCLSSLKTTERRIGWTPSVIFQGRVHHRVGSLLPEAGEHPKFAQLYVFDQSLESHSRYENMVLDSSLSVNQKELLKEALITVQNDLHQSNPFIKDFLQIMELPEEDVANGKLVISAKAPNNEHRRRYNAPTNLQEVSILTDCEKHDLVLQKRGGGLQYVSDLNPKGMPLHFTLLFPHGTYGWDPESRHEDGKRRITAREFYTFHLNVRNLDNMNFLHRSGKLFQEWICMGWVVVENQRLNYQRQNQKALRADSYKNLRDATAERFRELEPRAEGLFRDDHQQPLVGRRIILSSSFSGSPRWYNAKFQDGMAIVREYHKPDYFITMTCNPKWPEIEKHLLPGQAPQDRPDLIAKVFKQKKDQMMQDLKGGLLGQVVAHMEVTEFQKRGLPHEHILIILANHDRPITSDSVDDVVVAELPPPSQQTAVETGGDGPSLENIVLQNMIHGPCGEANPNSPCMENGKCSKGYPKEFMKQTIVDPDNFYAIYRRRSPSDGGRTAVKSGYTIDNRWVVPYNPYLSRRYNCHINVEVCSSPKAAKYLYKYVTKGNDRAMVSTEIENQPRDEISEYEDLRSVGSSEAVWHLMSYPITERFPSVMALRVHLDEEQQVVFDLDTEDEALEKQRETELTAFFKFNRINSEIDISSMPKYVDLPKGRVYDKAKKEWRVRKQNRGESVIGRLHSVNPVAGETFYLRMLLHNDHCKGKTSFDDMLLLPSGMKCETYKEVCSELGLLADDMEWRRILQESAVTRMCPQIREMFVTILIFVEPTNPLELFNEFWSDWTDDFERRQNVERHGPLTEIQKKTLVLLDLDLRLQSFERQLSSYGLPIPTAEELAMVQSITSTEPAIIREELDYNLDDLITAVQEKTPMFTAEQSTIFDTVMEAVTNGDSLQIFIDARGGCGKTFLLNTILGSVRSMEPGGCTALAMATTGIAANLLDLGRTFHSRLKAPLKVDEDSMLHISAQSNLAKLIVMSKLLMVDEATMLDKFMLEALDRTLRDLLRKPDCPFGGKIIILAGDFRQCLPVVPGATRAGTVSHCINQSYLWNQFKVMKLSVNMRVNASGNTELQKFDEWTLGIGNGNVEIIDIPESMIETRIVPNSPRNSSSEGNSMKDFCQKIFPNIGENISVPGWLDGRSILAPTNKEVMSLNCMMNESLPGIGYKFSSSDMLDNTEDGLRFNIEYLNTLCPNGFPPHNLILKKGMPLMLLRNINPREGLCNGTRLVYDGTLGNKVLQCTIVGSGRSVLIPRISFVPQLGEYPFSWQRRQFPVKPAFAMTINKAQGNIVFYIQEIIKY